MCRNCHLIFFFFDGTKNDYLTPYLSRLNITIPTSAYLKGQNRLLFSEQSRDGVLHGPGLNVHMKMASLCLSIIAHNLLIRSLYYNDSILVAIILFLWHWLAKIRCNVYLTHLLVFLLLICSSQTITTPICPPSPTEVCFDDLLLKLVGNCLTVNPSLWPLKKKKKRRCMMCLCFFLWGWNLHSCFRQFEAFLGTLLVQVITGCLYHRVL